MSVISDSRRPARARQALGQVVVRLSALRFANCAPVACYGCADQALFQCLFLIYLFYYLLHSLTFQFDVKLVSSGFFWLVCHFQTLHLRPWLVNKTQNIFSFQRLFCRSSFLAKKKSIFSLSLSRFSNKGNRNLNDGYSVWIQTQNLPGAMMSRPSDTCPLHRWTSNVAFVKFCPILAIL